jgi:methanogenic corrinoid protein MtbC1
MLMLRAVKQVPLLVAGLRARGSTAKVIVGGAPFRLDTDLWRSVGADAGAIKASEAPGLVAELRRRG